MPRFVLAPAAPRDARTAASTVSPTERSPALLELGAERDAAAQHVLVGGVVEVVARGDVAGLLGAHLQHAGQLRGAYDVGACRLLDPRLRHAYSLPG